MNRLYLILAILFAIGVSVYLLQAPGEIDDVELSPMAGQGEEEFTDEFGSAVIPSWVRDFEPDHPSHVKGPTPIYRPMSNGNAPRRRVSSPRMPA